MYDLTIRELFRELVLLKERQEQAHDRDMVQAWHVAALTRGSKGLPKLETLLTKKPGRRRQSAQEQIAMWQVAAARFGGVFRPADPKVVIRGR